MMEAVNISETSVYSYESVWRNVPEGSNLHTRLRNKLKAHTARSYSSDGRIISLWDLSVDDSAQETTMDLT
jgi:hypothetical protein